MDLSTAARTEKFHPQIRGFTDQASSPPEQNTASCASRRVNMVQAWS